jgi:hypothetical protein
MMVCFDNATPHTAKCIIDYPKANRLVRVPPPAVSLDLAPSDFYPFGKLKMALMRAAFADEDELLQGVMEALKGISREELEVVFEEWLLRLDMCIQKNGEYVE